jgi:hypothetical protein
MVWRRKQSRYGWGTAVENELRKLLTPYLPVNCRSSRSGGLFDVWALSSRCIYLFQVKRLGRYKTIYGQRRLNTLLRQLDEAVTVPNAHVFIATRRNVAGRVQWLFHYRIPVDGGFTTNSRKLL